MEDLDRKLARRARRGDRRALAALYERYRARVFGFLVRAMRDRADAEDVFQEVWMKVTQGLQGFDPDRGTFRAWLFRIAANAAVDRRRRDGVREMDELDAPAESVETRRVDLLVADGADPERVSAAREARMELDRHLATLDPRQRAAVLLRHQQGLSYTELARVMGVAEGTAKTLVHRGVVVLRTAMKDWKRPT